MSMKNGFGKRVLTLYAEPKNSLLLDHDINPLPRRVNVHGLGLEQNLEPHVIFPVLHCTAPRAFPAVANNAVHLPVTVEMAPDRPYEA